MKKIFYLLFALTVLSACGSDDPNPDPNPPVNPPITEWGGNWNDTKDSHYAQYQGMYNPLYGDWIVTKSNGKDVSDFKVYQFAEWCALSISTKKPAEGVAPKYDIDLGECGFNDKAYKTPKGEIFKYELANDKSWLTIDDGTTKLTLKPYDNNGVWKWNGDWNNPKDLNYKPEYEGKYNPIVGTWRLTHIGDYEVSPSNVSYYRFNEDFTVEEASHYAGTYRDKHKYWINNTGVKEDAFNTHPSYTYSYRIDGNKLYYRIMLPAPPDMELTFVKYQ